MTPTASHPHPRRIVYRGNLRGYELDSVIRDSRIDAQRLADHLPEVPSGYERVEIDTGWEPMGRWYAWKTVDQAVEARETRDEAHAR